MAAKKKSEKSEKSEIKIVEVDVRKELKKIFDDMLKKADENSIRYSDIKHIIHKFRELL